MAAFDFVEHGGYRLLDIHAREESRVDHPAALGVVRLLLDVAALDHGDDLQSEVSCEGVVARVVCRHGHDGPRTVSRQHVVRYVDWDLLAREGVYGV